MKQFAQCTNCHQWYTRTATAPVEVYQGDALHCIAIWCVACIQEAEHRSAGAPELPRLPASWCGRGPQDEPTLPATFQQVMDEHLHLMDRALYDDEETLVPVIQEFVERAQLYQVQNENATQRQRLLSHVHYWETFLKTLHPGD